MNPSQKEEGYISLHSFNKSPAKQSVTAKYKDIWIEEDHWKSKYVMCRYGIEKNTYGSEYLEFNERGTKTWTGESTNPSNNTQEFQPKPSAHDDFNCWLYFSQSASAVKYSELIG